MTQEKVIAILQEVKPTRDLTDVQDIIEGGYLDSFELMSLISLLADGFGVEIGVDEIVPENFNSADAMLALIEKLQDE